MLLFGRSGRQPRLGRWLLGLVALLLGLRSPVCPGGQLTCHWECFDGKSQRRLVTCLQIEARPITLETNRFETTQEDKKAFKDSKTIFMKIHEHKQPTHLRGSLQALTRFHDWSTKPATQLSGIMFFVLEVHTPCSCPSTNSADGTSQTHLHLSDCT